MDSQKTINIEVRFYLQVERYYINENGMFITTKIENLKENKNKKLEKLNSGVTFKLELEDEEKQARSKLVLPYLK